MWPSVLSVFVVFTMYEVSVSVENSLCGKGCKCNSYEMCKDCIDGYYLQDYNCQRCSSKCLNCQSKTFCTQCEEGFYVNSYNKSDNSCDTCSDGCSLCLSKKNCLKCEDGYFRKGKSCSKCMNNCKYCTFENKCDECYDNYNYIINNSCLLKCSNGTYLQYSECLPCKNNCAVCTSSYDCLTCKPGYYGNICEQKCPIGCNNNGCEQETGKCSCKENFVGETCNLCSTDKFGLACDQNCSLRCMTCNTTEHCPDCQTSYNGSKCENNLTTSCNHKTGNCDYGCNTGFWGERCEYECNELCHSNTCHRNNGSCSYGCLNGFHGRKCDCPHNCLFLSNTLCTKCNETFGKTAESCICTSDACLNSTLDRERNSCCKCNGNCRSQDCYNGCKKGFYGLRCLNKCSSTDSSCVECATQEDGQYGGCILCQRGYYPDTAAINFRCKHCSRTCVDDNCDDRSGYCLKACTNGSWGDLCEKTCFEKCSNCNMETGQCTACKNSTLYGSGCDSKCNSNCKDQICDMLDGKCSFGCKEGFYGEMCRTKCIETCLNRTCDREKGSCDYGCIEGLACAHDKTYREEEPFSTTKRLIYSVVSVCFAMLTISAIATVVKLVRKRQNSQHAVEENRIGGELVTSYTARNQRTHSRGHNRSVSNNERKQRLPRKKRNGRVIDKNTATNAEEDDDELASGIVAEYASIERKRHSLSQDNVIQNVDADIEMTEDLFPSDSFDNHIYFNTEEVLNRSVPLYQLGKFVQSKDIRDYTEEFQEFPTGLVKPYEQS